MHGTQRNEVNRERAAVAMEHRAISRPSCTGPDPAIGLPMASLTYWTKLIDSSNRRVFFLRGPETQHGVLTSLGEYKNDKNKNILIIIWE